MTKSDRIGPTPELQKKGGIEQVESPDKGDRRIVTRRRQGLFDTLGSRGKLTDRQKEAATWIEALWYRTGVRGAQSAVLRERVDCSESSHDYTNRQISAQAAWIGLQLDWPVKHRELLYKLICGGEAQLWTIDDVSRFMGITDLRDSERRKTVILAIQDLLDTIAESPYRDDEIDC